MSIFEKLLEAVSKEKAEQYKKAKEINQRVAHSKKYSREASGDEETVGTYLEDNQRVIALFALFALTVGIAWYGSDGTFFIFDKEKQEEIQNDEMMRLAAMGNGVFSPANITSNFTPVSYGKYCGIAEAQNGTGVRYKVSPFAYQEGRGLCPSQDRLINAGYSYIEVPEMYTPKPDKDGSCGVAMFVNNFGVVYPTDNAIGPTGVKDSNRILEVIGKKYSIKNKDSIATMRSTFNIVPKENGTCPSNYELRQNGKEALEKLGFQDKYTFMYVDDYSNEKNKHAVTNYYSNEEHRYPVLPVIFDKEGQNILSDKSKKEVQILTSDTGTFIPGDHSKINLIKDIVIPLSKEDLAGQGLSVVDHYAVPTWMSDESIRENICQGHLGNCGIDRLGFYLFNRKEPSKFISFVKENNKDSNGVEIPPKFLNAKTYKMSLGDFSTSTITTDGDGTSVLVTQSGNSDYGNPNYLDKDSFFTPNFSAKVKETINGGVTHKDTVNATVPKEQAKPISDFNENKANSEPAKPVPGQVAGQPIDIGNGNTITPSQEAVDKGIDVKEELAKFGDLNEAMEQFENAPDKLDPSQFPPPGNQ